MTMDVNRLIHVHRTVRTPPQGVQQMMRVFGAKSRKHDLPLIGPTVWNLTYQWPVHSIGPDYLPEEMPPEPTHLIVYRDREDAVHFLQINSVTQRLLALARENPSNSGLDLLNTIAAELSRPIPASVITAGAGLLDDLRQRGVILGTRT